MFILTNRATKVEQYCQQIRNGQRVESTADANQAHRARWLSRVYRSDGTMCLSVELCREMGELVMAAIDAAMSAEAANCDESLFARQADALVEIARSFLSESAGEPAREKSNLASRGDHYQVMVHVSQSALEDRGGKSDLPVESVRRLTCDGQVKEIIEDDAGVPLEFGRKKRTISKAMKMALLARDRHCRFPGCTNDKWVDGHHVKHWADGGETTLENLVLLCSTHHRALHEGGFEIRRDFKGEWYFRTSSGRAVVGADISHISRETISADEISEPTALYLVTGSQQSRVTAPG